MQKLICQIGDSDAFNRFQLIMQRPAKQIVRGPVRLIMLILLVSTCNVYAQNGNTAVDIQVDLRKKSATPIKPIWAWFGYDEPNYTYMKDGKKLLTELADLSPVPVFVRAHNLLTSGDGKPALKWGSTNAYTEDANGNPVYNWTIVDSIFDTYIKRGMKPLAQVGFMPEALSVKPESDGVQTTPDKQKVKHYTGWSYPPKSYEKYAALVFEWVKHSIERYGKKEVESWYWELWNEPDISYWKGTPEEYIKLYDYVADAIKRALPTAKVGGPETTNPGSANAAKFLKTFLTHIVSGKNHVTGKTGAPLDFITFHAKGSPKLIDSVVWMNAGVQLNHIDKGFEIIASFPSLKKLPVIIGESDPEGCAACSEDVFPQNAYRNGTLYSSYTAATFTRKYDLAEKRGIDLVGAVTWAFEFEDQPWFRGFRDLATNGVDKPVLNVFRMFGMMQGKRAAVSSSSVYNYRNVTDSSVRGKEADLNAFATIEGKSAAVMVWNYHDKNDLTVPATPVKLSIQGIPAKQVLLTEYRIDQEHSNAYVAWKKMGSPKTPDAAQIDELERAGQLAMFGSPQYLNLTNGQLQKTIELPRQAVSLFRISWQ